MSIMGRAGKADEEKPRLYHTRIVRQPKNSRFSLARNLRLWQSGNQFGKGYCVVHSLRLFPVSFLAVLPACWIPIIAVLREKKKEAVPRFIRETPTIGTAPMPHAGPEQRRVGKLFSVRWRDAFSWRRRFWPASGSGHLLQHASLSDGARQWTGS